MVGYLYAVVAIMMWSGNVLVSKLAAGQIHPLAITFSRLLVAVLIMAVFLARSVWYQRAVVRHYWPKLAILGGLSMAFYQCLSYQAAETTTANHMAVITAINPLLTMLVSVCMLGEMLTIGMIAGGCLSIAGIICLIAHGQPASLWHEGLHAGDSLMFAAAWVYALYSVLIRKWVMPLTVWQSTFMQVFFALLCMTMVCLVQQQNPMQWNDQTLPLVLYAGILASVLLPFFWIRAVFIIGPSRCSMFMNVLPVLTAVLGSIFLGERIQSDFVIGTLLVIIGVILAQTVKTPLLKHRDRPDMG